MSLKQKLVSVENDIQTGGIDALVGGLKDLTSISAAQYRANQSAVQQVMKPLVTAVRTNLKNNKDDIGVQVNANIDQDIKKFKSLIPPNVAKQYSSDLNRLKTETTKEGVTNAIEKEVQNRTNAIEAIIFKQAMDQQQVTSIQFAKLKDPKRSTVQNAIQLSITPFKPLLRERIPHMTTPSDAPQSIKFLSKYAVLEKKMPFGQITDQQGLSYVGVEKQDLGEGQSRMVPFKSPKLQKTALPDIPLQFRFHANKTINSWNRFIEDQAKFINLVNSISTPQNRLAYVEKQFRNLNLATFSAEVLATLVYYYVFVPMEKYFKTYEETESSEQNFYTKYQVGASPVTNPLLLSSDKGVLIAKMLLNYKIQTKPTTEELATDVCKVIVEFKSVLNQSNIQKLTGYITARQLEAYTFFAQSGLDTTAYAKLLKVEDYSSVKMKRFILKSAFTNHQFVTIVNKITSKKDENKKNIWDFVWGSQYIPCHDYIWDN